MSDETRVRRWGAAGTRPIMLWCRSVADRAKEGDSYPVTHHDDDTQRSWLLEPSAHAGSSEASANERSSG
jgi:hypothetical protein